MRIAICDDNLQWIEIEKDYINKLSDMDLTYEAFYPYAISINNTDLIVGDTAAINFQYQWQSSFNGLIWTDIPLATDSKYVVTEQDWNKLLRCKITDSNGRVFLSFSSNEVALFSAQILESNIGSVTKIGFEFSSKSETLNDCSMQVKLYIDGELKDNIEVSKSDQLLGWVLSDFLLEDKYAGKEMYAELYLKSNTGYTGKVVTPVVTI